MFYDNYQRRLSNDKEGINYDVAVVPKGANGGEHYSAFVANTWVLNAKAKEEEQKAGLAFMKYFLGEEAQKNKCIDGRRYYSEQENCSGSHR